MACSTDSEPGEEDTGGPQLQRTIRAPNNTPLGTPSGDSDTLLASSLHTTPSTLTGLSQTDEFSDWSGSQQTVVERDSKNASFLPEGGLRRGSINGAIPDSPRPLQNPKPPILPPPSPRFGQRPSANPMPSGRGSSTPLTPRKKTLMPSQYQDTVAEEFEEKVKRPKSSAGSQVSGQDSRPVTPLSESSGRVSILRASPKLVRSGSKIFEKLRCLEERRKSLDQTDSPFPVQSWLPLRKARSFDQPGADGLATGLESSTEELRDDLRDGVRSEVGGYTLRYPSLRYKTASLDDRGAFSGRVSDIEARFSQELSRIKRTVSQQQLIRSSQDLSQRSPSPQRTPSSHPAPLHPAPTQVLKDSKAPEIQEQKPAHAATARKPLIRSCATVNQIPQDKEPHGGVKGQTAPVSEKSSNGSIIHHQVVKQSDTRLTSHPPSKANISASKPMVSKALPPKQEATESHIKRVPDYGSEPPPTSTQAPPALEIAQRGIGREKGTTGGETRGETRYLPWATPAGPTQRSQGPPGKGGGQVKKHSESHTSGKTNKTTKSKGKSRRHRVMSPELESSDDSYVSADEDPREAPVFEIPLQSALVNAGSEVLLKCIITAKPSPEVIWRKDRITVKNSPTHQIRTEGERHTLFIRWALPSDSGIYIVTARNEVGEASSCGALTVKPAPATESPAHRGTPRDVLSPITSDDEYLSPQEDLSEPTTPQHGMAAKTAVQHSVTFKAPPSFKVAVSDQMVFEGQEIILRVQVLGEPKPMISWLKNKQQVKSGGKYHMTEEEGGVFSLHIVGTDKRDSGFYTCKAINEYGTKQCEAKVEVRGKTGHSDGSILMVFCYSPYDLAQLTYSVQQQAVGSVQWTVIASNLKETSYCIKSLTKGYQYLFRVVTHTTTAHSKPSQPSDSVKLLDRGPYQQEVPVITDRPELMYMVENHLLCVTVTLNHVDAIVTWKRGSTILRSVVGVCEMSMPDDDQHSLTIFSPKKSFLGPLFFEARNRYGADKCTINIELAESPRFESIMEDIEIRAGETARFVVVVDGKPVPDIMWYKDGELLVESGHFNFVYDDAECSLVILNATPEDSGVYTCTARNVAGEVSCKAELQVCKEEPGVGSALDESDGLKFRRLSDYYTIHKEIGRGAFSYVRHVVEKNSGLDFAAKFISSRGACRESARKEMSILSRLSHERIVYFQEVFEKRSALIIIMELYPLLAGL
ncbi:hypothetical protein GDO78_016220 [Eleutherodactylus coqui]|uniref:Striated muscle preferentially expressed protein kinase n=1 Tax=Eleutherodactylus coqui TaxID=57060 RepID=A0A8J6BKB9_ELECQ|nr:hypothetical protein GDO78_016220 [Eleutherodactylus coqui]